MNNQKLILMKGISCAGKSTIVESLQKNTKGAIVLSSDSLRESLGLSKTDGSVFPIMDEMTHEHLKQGNTVILDATHLTHKRHQHYKRIAQRYDVTYECHYVITHPWKWEANAKKRIETKWLDYSMNEMLNIRQNMYRALCFPLEHEFDKAIYYITDIELPTYGVPFFKHYYQENKELFLNDTEKFFEVLYEYGMLNVVMPELSEMYGFDQQNKHHNLPLEKHTFKLCKNLKNKSEVMIWAGLLHDIGKTTKGIKATHLDGNCSYIGHQGASTEIAICILARLGFKQDFVNQVCRIINKHMYLPYNGTLKQKTIDFLGQDLYEDLLEFREADMNAKDI